MSRVGRKPITIPKNVKVAIQGNQIHCEGPKGKNTLTIVPSVRIEQKENTLLISRQSDSKEDRAFHGTTRALVHNALVGVAEGFVKELEIQGVGYKAQMQGKTLVLTLGFSHPVNYVVPEGVVVETPKPTQIIIKGVDKQKVGLVASQIRQHKKPEPYKGKGIRYLGEHVRKKAGKAVGK